MKWREIHPIFSHYNIFTNNYAPYGPINAAFPFRIILEYEPNQNIICLNRLNQCYIQIPNVGSGNILDLRLRFAIKDIFNETITSLNNQ